MLHLCRKVNGLNKKSQKRSNSDIYEHFEHDLSEWVEEFKNVIVTDDGTFLEIKWKFDSPLL